MSDDLMTTSPTTASEPAKETPPDRFELAMDEFALELTLTDALGKDASKAHRKGYRREIVAQAREVAGPTPTAMEWTLAKTIAIAWFVMRNREGIAACSEGASMRVVEYRWKLLDKATRRYCMLLKTLAAVRRAGSPAVQVNIAGGTNQTNIGIP